MDYEKSEQQYLIKNTRVYRRRWLILMIFNLLCCAQAMVWNTFGPIAESSELVLNWSDSNVGIISNLSNISYMLFVIPISMLMDTKGLRFAMILSSAGLMFATGIRCFTLEKTTITITAYVCGFIQGAAATVPFSGPPLVASLWFPPEQRPTATAIGSFFNYLGLSISFIVGPQLVPNPIYTRTTSNTTSSNSIFVTVGDVSNVSMTSNNTDELINGDAIKQGIFNLLYINAAFSGLAFISILIYFPDKPPVAPSITASIERTDYKQALLKIIRNKPLWLIVIAGSLPTGISGIWIALLDVVLKPLGVSQVDAGWMGFWHTIIGCLSSIFIAKFSDVFYRRRKVLLIILYTCASVCCLWFALLCSGALPLYTATLYASCILFGIFINGSIPLFYEISVEASYPVAEGVTGGFYTATHNLFGFIFLCVISAPSVGTKWMNWTTFGSLVLVIPMLIMFPERYHRTDIDLSFTCDIKSSVE